MHKNGIYASPAFIREFTVQLSFSGQFQTYFKLKPFQNDNDRKDEKER